MFSNMMYTYTWTTEDTFKNQSMLWYLHRQKLYVTENMVKNFQVSVQNVVLVIYHDFNQRFYKDLHKTMTDRCIFFFLDLSVSSISSLKHILNRIMYCSTW